MTTELRSLIRDLPLKDMDSSLLSFSIIDAAKRANAEADAFNQVFNLHKLNEAMALAAYLHRRQTRANRGNMPRTHYIEHPFRNALRLLRYGITDHDTIVSAMLHDTVEDCVDEFPTTANGRSVVIDLSVPITPRDNAFSYIDAEFGPFVLHTVQWLTNDLAPENDSRTKPEKRSDYLIHFDEAIKKSARIVLNKHSDVMDNALSLKYNDPAAQGMVGHLALKYRPTIPLLRARMHDDDVRELVPADKMRDIFGHLDSAEALLSKLVGVAGP